jgi:hypothetical protein
MIFATYPPPAPSGRRRVVTLTSAVRIWLATEPVDIRLSLTSELVHLDGTGIKVLVPGEKGSYTSQFTVPSNADAVAYHFTSTKEGEHLADLLRIGTDLAFRGYLVADAASNMNRLYDDGSILECGCWSHYPERMIIRSRRSIAA